ncbi:uncharacterized protein LOC141858770 isoform X1 [Brevipalpus obovatus]|uniref:uncharacterized protein LOC141858770 isoform X1 n=1 Tax=Brevipalpus obovatus TaxID=246614 RepID=UPI003D9F371A
MGCGAAKATKTCETPNMDEKVPKPVAFEIPLDPVITSDNGSEDMSKKQPPKRLARLEEQRLSIPTAEELEERLQKAEERRQEIIDEKVQKSRAFQAKILGERVNLFFTGESNFFFIQYFFLYFHRQAMLAMKTIRRRRKKKKLMKRRTKWKRKDKIVGNQLT